VLCWRTSLRCSAVSQAPLARWTSRYVVVDGVMVQRSTRVVRGAGSLGWGARGRGCGVDERAVWGQLRPRRPRPAPSWSRAVFGGAASGSLMRRARLLAHTAGPASLRAPCVRALARTLRAGALARVVGASLDTRRLKPAFGGVGWRQGWRTSSLSHMGVFGERGAVGWRNAHGFGRSGQSRGMTVARDVR
jgi:hypothetical protein